MYKCAHLMIRALELRANVSLLATGLLVLASRTYMHCYSSSRPSNLR
jgi:hypothetical protein